MIETLPLADLDRMVRAVELVRERLLRASAILEAAGVSYAVIGGNAVAAWVSRKDESAVRNTRDVDILLRDEDLPAARAALESAGFVYRHVRNIDLFLDGPGTKARDGLHILPANRRLNADDPLSTPDPSEFLYDKDRLFRHMTLEGLVRLKLLANRDKDRTHLQDLASVGLIDASWANQFPPPLDDRLRIALNSPDAEPWPEDE